MTDNKFTVQMHATFIDQLDEIFSPRDAVAALNELFLELPGSIPKYQSLFEREQAANFASFAVALTGTIGLQPCPDPLDVAGARTLE